MTNDLLTPQPLALHRRGQRWLPERVLVTRAAAAEPHGRAIAERCQALGLDVVDLPGNRITSLRGEDERATYRRAKSTLAVVNAPPSALRLQPIPPSADYAIHLAEGCPGHCQYCYLAGSLSGPPVVRAYANLPAILDAAAAHERPGAVTSFECSCYTDPLGIEHLTGSLAAAVERFAGREAATLRFTTKYAAVEPLLGLDHGGRTQVRVSVNAAEVSRRFEGGTSPMPERLAALRRLALTGYPVGVVIAPILAVDGWEEGYDQLLADVASAVEGTPAAEELTVECITHRFTATSRDVQLAWYPRTKLDLGGEGRVAKPTKGGGRKYVYERPVMRPLRSWFDDALARHLPAARLLYWT